MYSFLQTTTLQKQFILSTFDPHFERELFAIHHSILFRFRLIMSMIKQIAEDHKKRIQGRK